MLNTVNICFHASQFPDAVRRDLVESLRQRAINHKFHYDSIKQTQKWLRLHETCSPARTDPDVGRTYDRAFEETAARLGTHQVHVVGLGCGGGAKDCALINALKANTVRYTAVDVSSAMVLVATQTVSSSTKAERCSALVCDLATAEDIPEVIQQLTAADGGRLFTFFGMLPNFEPQSVLPKLAALVRPGDHLLCSANLAPGPDYRAGVQKVLPLYDNDLTRDWLMTFLSDLGVSETDGEMIFRIEEHPPTSGLLRIAAYFRFLRRREVRIDTMVFTFEPREVIRLFFSYRHTPKLVEELLLSQGLSVVGQWISASGEEGLFLVGLK